MPIVEYFTNGHFIETDIIEMKLLHPGIFKIVWGACARSQSYIFSHRKLKM